MSYEIGSGGPIFPGRRNCMMCGHSAEDHDVERYTGEPGKCPKLAASYVEPWGEDILIATTPPAGQGPEPSKTPTPTCAPSVFAGPPGPPGPPTAGDFSDPDLNLWLTTLLAAHILEEERYLPVLEGSLPASLLAEVKKTVAANQNRARKAISILRNLL